MHRGHLSTFALARERVERAGFAVLGCWAVLASPGVEADFSAVEPNFEMSDDFRRTAAELAVEGDDLVAVGQPEKAHPDDFAAVVAELQAAATDRLKSHLPERERRIKIFYVCSFEDAKNQRPAMNLYASHNQGVVVVLGSGDEMLEKPLQSVLVSERDAVAQDIRSAKLRVALVRGDACYAHRALSSAAARFVLAPSKAELAQHSAEFVQLSSLRGLGDEWPCAKFSACLPAALEPRDQRLAVLVATEGVGVASLGYLRLLRLARDRLRRGGFAVVAAWISLCGRDSSEEEEFSAEFTAHVAQLAVLDDDFVSISAAATIPHEAGACLQQFLSAKFAPSLDGRRVSVFHVASSDRAATLQLAQGMCPEIQRGAVIVPLSEDEMLLEKLQSMLFVADPLPADTPPRAVEALRVRGTDASRILPPAAARFILSPTEAERTAFASYFNRFGAPSMESLVATKGTLKKSMGAWVGPDGLLGSDDLLKLVQALDPSWDASELEALRALTSRPSDGSVRCDDLIDWAFAGSS